MAPGAGARLENALYTWLEGAVARGLLRRDGEGTRRRPFRYWLEGRVAVWLEDPMTLLHMPELVMGEAERKSLLGDR